MFEGATVIYCDLRYVCKEEMEIYHNNVFIVKEGMAYMLDIIAACCQHLLGWLFGWSTNCLP